MKKKYVHSLAFAIEMIISEVIIFIASAVISSFIQSLLLFIVSSVLLLIVLFVQIFIEKYFAYFLYDENGIVFNNKALKWDEQSVYFHPLNYFGKAISMESCALIFYRTN